VFVYSLSGLDLSGATGAAQVEVEDNETTARTAVYQTFARMLMAPGDDEWAITADGGWSKELATAGTLLEYSWDIDDQPVPADRAAADAARAALDGVMASGAYADDVSRNHDEVVRFYEYYGLKTSDDGPSVDHVVTECDFLQFLTYKEAASASDRLRASFRRAQLDFLDRQFLRWVPALAERVAADGSSPFHTWATAALARYATADHAYVKGLLGQ